MEILTPYKLNEIEAYLKNQLALVNDIKKARSNNPRTHLFSNLLFQELPEKKSSLGGHFLKWIEWGNYIDLVENNKNPNIPCVYIIENFYIGKTVDIYNRMEQHLFDCAMSIHLGWKCTNYEKCMNMLTVLNKRKIRIKLICNDPSKEVFYIKKYAGKGYELTNKLHNKKNNQ